MQVTPAAAFKVGFPTDVCPGDFFKLIGWESSPDMGGLFSCIYTQREGSPESRWPMTRIGYINLKSGMVCIVVMSNTTEIEIMKGTL